MFTLLEWVLYYVIYHKIRGIHRTTVINEEDNDDCK